ncbi:MAG: PKD domain-containing protein [bacterium]
MAVPDGADPKVFSLLSKRLLSELGEIANGRTSSQLPPQSPPLMLESVSNGDGTYSVSWRYFLPGDYNLDGEVSVSDITPVALRFMRSVTDGEGDIVEKFIDGDGSGEIGVGDVTTIALNFGARYKIQFGIYDVPPFYSWQEEKWETAALYFGTASFDPADESELPLVMNLDQSSSHYGWTGVEISPGGHGLPSGEYYFGLRDADGACEFTSSAPFHLGGRDGPSIAGVSPLCGLPGTEVRFEAELTAGAGPFTYEWDFGGGAQPATSTDAAPVVVLSTAPGVYEASVTVSNNYSSDTFAWFLEVKAAPALSRVNPRGGAPGEDVRFTAEVEGAGPFTYFWNFGDAATPDTSDEERPLVTLTAVPGDYPASVTVFNDCGSTEFEFSVGVGAVPEILSVSPSLGMAGQILVFAAEVEGDAPFDYTWNFGEAGIPDSADSAQPSVRLTDAPGDYAASLLVENHCGSSLHNFVVSVIPESADGYTLVAPLGEKRTYLIDMDGNPVHTWDSNYYPGLSAELEETGHLLRLGYVGGFWFNGMGKAGRIEEYDWDGNLVWSYELYDWERCCHHQFERLPNGNVLLIVWNAYSRQDAVDAGRNPAGISQYGMWVDSIVEIEPVLPDGGEVVWEWKAWDHLVQDYDPSKANYGNPAEHPELIDFNLRLDCTLDWTHINTVSYNAELDQIAVSPRDLSEIWVIDHSTTMEEAAGHTGGRYGRGGDILYRWGNPQNYRAGGPGSQRLFGQHNPYWIEDGLDGAGNLLVFNNNAGTLGGESFSSVVQLATPLNPDGSYYLTDGVYGPAEPAWQYLSNPLGDFHSQFMGSAQRLPGGNTLICSALQNRIFEVNPMGETTWEFDCRWQAGEPFDLFKAIRYTPDYPGLSALGS